MIALAIGPELRRLLERYGAPAANRGGLGMKLALAASRSRSPRPRPTTSPRTSSPTAVSRSRVRAPTRASPLGPCSASRPPDGSPPARLRPTWRTLRRERRTTSRSASSPRRPGPGHRRSRRPARAHARPRRPDRDACQLDDLGRDRAPGHRATRRDERPLPPPRPAAKRRLVVAPARRAGLERHRGRGPGSPGGGRPARVARDPRARFASSGGSSGRTAASR